MTKDDKKQDTVELSLADEVEVVPSSEDDKDNTADGRKPPFPSVRKVARDLGVAQKNAENIFQPGDVVDGRYEVERSLGVGAMGSVFLVRHKRLDKPFALKVIIPELALREDFVARFEREAAACSKLNHPNCISVTDFGHTDNGSLYLVMEYVDGVPLSDVVKGGPVSLEDAMEYTLQVLVGLEHAHGKGIVHRDIKLENVMLCRHDSGEAQLKILDFGMARAQVRSNDQTAITRRGMVMGTPQYMAPEQLRNKPADERSDLYSTGVMFFRLLTARPLFEGDTMIDVLANKLNQPAPTLSEVTTFEYPEALEIFFETVLHRNPERRYASAREMMDALFEVRDEIRGRSTREFRAKGKEAVEKAEKAISSMPPRARGTITLGDLFHRPIDDLVYWYTCGRNPARANWRRRLKSLFRDRVGKLVLIRFAFVFMLAVVGGMSALVALSMTLDDFKSKVGGVLPAITDIISPSESPSEAPHQNASKPLLAAEETDDPADTMSSQNAIVGDAQTSVKKTTVASDSSTAQNSDTDDTDRSDTEDTASDTADDTESETVVAETVSENSLSDKTIPALSTAQPVPLDETLKGYERSIRNKMCTKSVADLSNYLLSPESNAGGGNYLLGRAQMCLGKHKDALQFFRNAVEIDAGYRNDSILAKDVKQIVLSGKAADEGLAFMRDVMGEAALPMLVKFAGHAQRKRFRQQTRDIVAEMGALDQVNLEASYDWDLNQATSCSEKREIVARIAALQTRRARTILIRARDMKAREGLFREKYIHECVRAEIIDAIKNMTLKD